MAAKSFQEKYIHFIMLLMIYVLISDICVDQYCVWDSVSGGGKWNPFSCLRSQAWIIWQQECK